jgi:Uma2 family endonuclease
MTRSLEHEKWKGLLFLVIYILCDEWDKPFEDGGELTMRRQDLDRGLEPDQCFWITHALAMQGKNTWDADGDPAPDLFVEIEVTQTILDRIEILALLGVKEVWKFDGQALEVGLLQARKKYRWGRVSRLFSGLDIVEVGRLLGQAASMNKLEWSRKFRRWVRKNKPGGNGAKE